MDSGQEAVEDPGQAAALRRRALVIVAQSTLIAALMTLIAAVNSAG